MNNSIYIFNTLTPSLTRKLVIVGCEKIFTHTLLLSMIYKAEWMTIEEIGQLLGGN